MDATPLEHVLEVAVATYCTGEVTVEPAAGLLTVTVAKAGAAQVSRTKTSFKQGMERGFIVGP
jgi:hypothetical protein